MLSNRGFSERTKYGVINGWIGLNEHSNDPEGLSFVENHCGSDDEVTLNSKHLIATQDCYKLFQIDAS